MNANPSQTQLSDEMLSAYIDGVLSASERTLVETAIQSDPDVAWRLETLRQTVQLLRSLRHVSMPASLNAESIMAAAQHTAQAEKAASRRSFVPEPQPSLWQRFLDFWRSGSPALRNAAISAMAIFVVFSIGSQFLSGPTHRAAPTSVLAPAAPLSVGEAGFAAPTEMAAATEAPPLALQPMAAELVLAEEPAAESAVEEVEDISAKSAAAPGALSEPSIVAAEAAGVDKPRATTVAVAAQLEGLSSQTAAGRGGIGGAPETSPGLVEQGRTEGLVPTQPGGSGSEDATGLDTALMESVAPMAAPASEPLPGAAPVVRETPPVQESPLAFAPAEMATPTRLPRATATAQPTATATPQVVVLAQPPAPTPMEASHVDEALPASVSWLWVVQGGAALAAISFLILWLRSRHPST